MAVLAALVAFAMSDKKERRGRKEHQFARPEQTGGAESETF